MGLYSNKERTTTDWKWRVKEGEILEWPRLCLWVSSKHEHNDGERVESTNEEGEENELIEKTGEDRKTETIEGRKK